MELTVLKKVTNQLTKKLQTTQAKSCAFINFSYQEFLTKKFSTSNSLKQRTLGKSFHSTHSYKIADVLQTNKPQ